MSDITSYNMDALSNLIIDGRCSSNSNLYGLVSMFINPLGVTSYHFYGLGSKADAATSLHNSFNIRVAGTPLQFISEDGTYIFTLEELSRNKNGGLPYRAENDHFQRVSRYKALQRIIRKEGDEYES